MMSPAYLFLLFVAKEQANMAVPWETQIQCRKVILLNKYWQNNQMNHADKCFCTFSMFSGHLVSSVWLPIKSHLLHKCGQVTTWNCYVQAKQQHLQGSGTGSVLPLHVILRKWSPPMCMPLRTCWQYRTHRHIDAHTQKKNSWTDPDACVGGIFDSSQKLVISGIEGNGERTVNNPTWQKKKSHYSVVCSWQNNCWPTSILKHTGDY